MQNKYPQRKQQCSHIQSMDTHDKEKEKQGRKKIFTGNPIKENTSGEMNETQTEVREENE